MAERLRNAVSPYLRAHADNPVDWWPWGPEPFAEAARRDVPVLISIGYATCHWCHVMARESFSDPEVAAYVNERFVPIKVDREEHPDVDSAYITAAGVFTPQLGWPLTVFATPTGGTFFAGTYFPPQPVQGMPSFRQVLDAVLDGWTQRRDQVDDNARRIVEALGAATRRAAGDLPSEEQFAEAVRHLDEHEDRVHGGFGGAPKFPVGTVLHFLLDRGSLGDERAQALAERTLEAIAASDLRDAVEGGFFRYSTQADWSDPHYERMLYDNSLLLSAYARIGRADVAEGIVGFLLRTLRQPGGAFGSGQDSESTIDGRRVEGGYYKVDAEARTRLEPPPVDDKVLTGWNGLAIEALALAGRLLERPQWLAAATEAADFLLEQHVRDDRLVRASRAGQVSTAVAALEDYGMLASGLLELATAAGEPQYAVLARRLVDSTLTEDGFAVPGGPDPVLAQHGTALASDPSEGAYPSGTSALAAAAIKLHLLTADRRYLSAAEAALAPLAGPARQQPLAFGAALSGMSALTTPVTQLVVVGEGSTASVARRWHRAGAVVAVADEQSTRAFAENGFELFEGRSSRDGASTAYLCENFVCRLPVTQPAELEALLRS